MKRVHTARHQKVLLSIFTGVFLLSMTGMVVAGGYSSVILSDQPFAYYPFDDGNSNDGGTAADATGTYSGTYVGSLELVGDVPGKVRGTSLQINPGSVSYVRAPVAPLGAVLGDGVSFEFWIKTRDARVNMRIFGTFNTGSNTSVTIAGNSGPAYEQTVGSTQIFMRKQGGGDYGAAFDQSVKDIYDGNWHHVVWTAENMANPGPDPYKVYVDGIAVPLTYGARWTAAVFANFDNPLYIANTGRATPPLTAASPGMEGQLDEFAIYDRVLTPEQILNHYEAAWAEPVHAANPSPAAGATNVPYDVALSWTPGEFAAAHDVYLGTTLDDVAMADRANPQGALISQDQDVNAFDPGPLAFGQTYYWRVDEVNAAPDHSIFKGKVWTFTVEPLSLVLDGEHVIATASSRNSEEEGPQNSINGSGLVDGLHSVEPTHMWLSGVVAAGDVAWAQYQFDKVYLLHQMQVWNHNTVTESLLGVGIKDAIIEYSLDGATWTSLDGDHQFARATGKANYASNTTIDFGGKAARYVRITALSNWGGVLPQYGLSEVQFLYVPTSARQPDPADAAVDVEPQLVLTWWAGRGAASHNVYFSSDGKLVADGTIAAVTVSEPAFDTGTLELGRSYYWRVDEVNQVAAPDVWEGDVWTFSTREYLNVDDFESYTDDMDAGQAIFQTWTDGYEDDTNGSLVGYDDAPFAERTVVHGGYQSMPLRYDNSGTAVYSEAERTFASPQDWTIHGADSLRLYFQGQPVTFVERTPGNIVMSAAGTDIFGTSDEFRLVSKQLTGNGAIIARVESLDNTNPWAKAGVMIRESLEVDAKHAMVVISPGNGVSFQRRVFSGDTTAHTTQAGVTTPVWLRLTRTGDVFKAEHSADGKTWVAVGPDPAASSATISMAASVHVGLALSSHSADVLATAQFAEVSTTGAVGGAWATAEIGVDHPGNDPAPLYVMLQDSGGRTKIVSHADPQATTRTGWQVWRIPLSEFAAAGVKLNSITKLAIGIGDRSSPTQGGAGLVYIDDIGFGRPSGNPVEPDPVPAGSYSSIVLADAPFAYYRFEDGSSNDKDTVADAVGAHSGTYVGAPGLVGDAPGAIGGTCLEIPGTDSSSYVVAPLNALGSVLGEGVSFEFWIKTTDARVQKRVFGSFTTGSNTSVSIASNAGPAYQATVGSTQVFLRKQGGGDYTAAFDQSVKNIYDGDWHHVVWTAEQMASPGPDPFKVYVDGVSVPLTYDARWTSAGFADFDNPFYIANAGRAMPFANATMAGQLDEFAVYDSVLTQEQVLTHYLAATPGSPK